MPKKRYPAAFKSKVALEALKGHKTLSEIASEYEVHPNQVSQWKRQLREGMENIFVTTQPIFQTREQSMRRMVEMFWIDIPIRSFPVFLKWR